jgi:hypothetical protein
MEQQPMTEGHVPEATSGKVGVVTIAARNYLASVVLLGESLRRVMPDWKLTAVVLDADAGELAALTARWPWMRFESPRSLAIDGDTLDRMLLYYDLTEFATAIKPSALLQQLETVDVAIYLDPDIEVFADLSDLASAAAAHGIALTPHVMAPSPRDFKETSDEAFLTTGQFNLGFVAVSSSGRPFLEYWAARLERYALIDFARGYFTDQRWVDAVPVLFEHQIMRDPGYNVAYWNLHQRTLSQEPDGSLHVDGGPLRFFHYSGHDAREPLTLSKYAPRTRIDVGSSPTLQRILRERARRIGAVEVETPAYRFSTMGDGRLVPKELRRGYWHAVEDAARAGAPPPPAPSWTSAAPAFDDWLDSRGPGGLPRLALLLWLGSAEGHSLFPDPERSRTEAFARWLLKEPCFDALADDSARRALAALRDRVPVVRPLGVNLMGYLAGEFGMGEYGRNVAASIRAAGLPVASIELHAEGHSHREQVPAGRTDARYALNVVVVNADMLGTSLVFSESWSSIQPRPTVGVWAWELPRMPTAMAEASILLDELWCGSGFIADALLGSGVDCPVHVHPWLVEAPAKTHLTRADLGLPGESFLFGFSFDFRSVVKRKNPQGLIEAYRKAFDPSDGATLVIKTLNGAGRPELEALRSLAADRPDVVIVDDVWTSVEMRAFYQLLDAYVSLHRSEGIGLGMLHAMAAGTPVVATGFSGNVDFMTSEVARLLPFEMVQVGDDAGPYPPEQWWAEPSCAAAAGALRSLAADPAAAEALGERGSAHVLSLFSRERSASWFSERLDRLAAI